MVSRTPAGTRRYTYAEYGDRVRRLANALDAAGVERGDRVGTVCWNHDRHFETYFGVPNAGAQLHTINPLLPDEHVQYIVENAADRILFVDPSLAEKVASAYDAEAFASVERIIVGGAAVPESVVRQFDDLGVEVLHAWGMTEMSPVGTAAHLKGGLDDADYDAQVDRRTTQGLVVPGLEFEVVKDGGESIEWDGEDFGELLVRGPWVTDEYYERPDANESDFEGSWLRTGDIVTVDPEGYIELVDRADDVIKSGGEWISSQELENAIMAHDGVSEAAVIGVPHEKWGERPVAFVVPTEGADRESLPGEIGALLREDYPDWWLPDAVEFIDAVPKTATGKFSKKDLREEFADASLIEGQAPESRG